jgi:hypothetical protein
MPFYRRFFSYIYAYEQNQKTDNAGFAKIEIREQTTCLELHMRTSRPAEHARLYLFVRIADSIQGFPLGDVSFTDGCANRRFTMDQTRLGDSDYNIRDAAGILLTCNEKICFVSQWDESPVNWESFRVYEKEEVSDENNETENNEAPATETPADLQTEELSLPEPILVAVPERKERLAPWPKVWEELLDTLPPLQPFADDRIRCVKAELKDLRLLPASNWHLCNNSFLLRSFFTHRYLLIGELPKPHRWFLGVPGIRYRQEHVMAAIFGFSDFLPDKNSAGETPFGYWLMTINESD